MNRSGVQLGCVVRLVSGCRDRRLVCCYTAVCRRDLLDTCLRHYLCAPGSHLSLFPPCSQETINLSSQDKSDDVNVGIRSTALLFGDSTRPVLSALSAASIACIAGAGYVTAAGVPFFVGTALAGAQLARVVFRTDYGSRASCWAGFVGCGWAGFWVWMGALADFLMLGTGLW